MEALYLNNDVPVFYVTLKSFPTGIIEAFTLLKSKHPSICERPFYVIFHEHENGQMLYRAAVEECYEGEGETYRCHTFVIPKGTYLSITLKGFMNQIDAIPGAFHRLRQEPGVDLSFPAVEWYRHEKEVICMLKQLPDPA